MKNLVVFLALACVALSVSSGSAQNIEGQIIASQYGTWKVEGYSPNTYSFAPGSCMVQGGASSFFAFQQGVPIKIVDGNPNLSEIVTAGATTNTNSACAVSLSPANNHQLPFYLTSGTGGLQEALTSNLTTPATNTVILNSAWHQSVGSSAGAVIAAAKGGSTINLVDITTTPYNWYGWNGSQYILVTLATTNPGVQSCLAFPGVDWVDQCNKANDALPASGGTVDGTGFTGNVYATTHMESIGGLTSKAVTLKLNPGTAYWFNQQFTTEQINASIASHRSGSAGACIVPIGWDSAIITDGFNSLGPPASFRLGPNASTYDFVCNANQAQSATNIGQETFRMDGVGMTGNASANMQGSILDIVGTYGPGSVNNSYIYTPYGQGLTCLGCGTFMFFNDMFNDTASSGQYPGSVVLIACGFNNSFVGGQIGDNGLYNPLLVIEDCSVNSDGSIGIPSTGAGSTGLYNSAMIRFEGTYFEPHPATVGSFSGAPTNVDSFQLTDPVSVYIGDGSQINVSVSSSQHNLFDIMPNTRSSFNGLGKGPVSLEGIVVGAGWTAPGQCLINNTFDPSLVAPELRCVQPTQNGPSWHVGKYKWEGAPNGTTNPTYQSTDYLNNENVASEVANHLQVPPLTFSQLPACSSTSEGAIATIIDATSSMLGTVAAGGGNVHASVYCNGTAWIVTGAAGSGSTAIQSLGSDLLLGYGSFATGSSTFGTNWGAYACTAYFGQTCTYSRTNSTAPPGFTYSQELTITANGDPSGSVGIITTPFYAFTASTTYQVSFWAKGDGVVNGTPLFLWADPNTSNVPVCSAYFYTQLFTTTWANYTVNCKPTTSGSLPISISMAGTSLGSFWIGDVTVNQVSPLPPNVLIGSAAPYGIAPATNAEQQFTVNGTTCQLQNSCTPNGAGITPATLYSAAGTPLPTCNAGVKGTQLTVSDATAPTYMTAYTSGGGVTAAVICSYNGSAYSWLNH